MVINYSVCGNCGHKSSDHKGNGDCKMRTCPCPGFKPQGS